MKVKKFVAPSMPEVMKKVRQELGKDAVILNSKVVQKGGIFGFFAKKNIEVIAAIDPQPIPAKKPVQQKLNMSPYTKKSDLLTENPLKKVEQKSEKENQDLLQEIQDLKKLMKEMSNREQVNNENYPSEINKINSMLVDQEINDEIRRDIIAILLEKWYLNKGKSSEKEVTEWVKDELLSKISKYDFGGVNYEKRYVNVVGPTGVGKTTTLAKIAAHSLLKHQKKVAFITTDTYRIAAIEQLKTYAQILDLPVEVAYNIEDFKKAKEKFKDYDLVLIDTAGRNFRDPKYVEDFKNVIDFDETMENFLVLSLTSKYKDIETIVRQFSLIDIHKFIFTKVDETSRYGSMINLILEHQIGVAYLTNGQDVPDDIIEAVPETIIKTIFEVEG